MVSPWINAGVELLKLAREAGVQELTYYGFTTDNCKRPAEQVTAFSAACVEAVKLISVSRSPFWWQETGMPSVFPKNLCPTLPGPISTAGHTGQFSCKLRLGMGFGGLQNPGTNRRKIQEQLRTHDISVWIWSSAGAACAGCRGFLPVQAVYADFFCGRPAMA